MTPRTYSRKEIAALMERAAELQSRGQDAGEDGLTLDELEAVAASSGIDPRALRQAASEMGGVSRENTDAQSDTQIFAERFVSFPNLSDESLAAATEEVLIELRHRFGMTSDPVMRAMGYGVHDTERIGKTMEWRHATSMGVVTTVQLRPRAEGIQLRMSQKVGWGSPTAEGVTYAMLLACMVALVALVAAKSAVVGVGAFALGMLVFGPLIRSLDVNWRAKKDRELESLADRLARTVASGLPDSDVSRPLLDDLEQTDALAADPRSSQRSRI